MEAKLQLPGIFKEKQTCYSEKIIVSSKTTCNKCKGIMALFYTPCTKYPDMCYTPCIS